MKLKELKPILEHLDENIEVKFSIVPHQEVPKQEAPKNEFDDNYRTYGNFIFGHQKSLEDPEGLFFTCWPIYGPFGLVGYLRQTNTRSFCNLNKARTKGTKYWKRVSIYMDQLLKAIGEFIYDEYKDGRDDFHVLFTQEDERFFVEKGLTDNKKISIREHNVGIVPLVYFEK